MPERKKTKQKHTNKQKLESQHNTTAAKKNANQVVQHPIVSAWTPT